MGHFFPTGPLNPGLVSVCKARGGEAETWEEVHGMTLCPLLADPSTSHLREGCTLADSKGGSEL